MQAEIFSNSSNTELSNPSSDVPTMEVPTSPDKHVSEVSEASKTRMRTVNALSEENDNCISNSEVNAGIMNHKKKRISKYKWRSREEVIANVKNKVSAELNLPDTAPPKGTPEWKENRQRLINTKYANMTKWGLGAALTSNRWFNSHIDLLIAVFPEYEIDEGSRKKKCINKYKWQSREEAISNVKNKVSAELNLPDTAPPEETPEWKENRQRLINTRSANIIKWGLGAALISNRWFNSYIDLLIAVFPEYEIDEELQKKKNKYKWQSREEVIANVKNKVSAELNLPDTAPPEGTPEWKENRQRLTNTRQANMMKWNLGAAFKNRNRWFNSHIDLLIAVFPEYEIDEGSRKKKCINKYKWQSREEVIANVKNKVSAELNLPDTAPPKGTHEWKENRQRLINTRRTNIIKWGLGAVFNRNQWFNSYIDLLIAVFPEYELKTRMSKYKWRSREETIANVKNKVSAELNLPDTEPPKETPEWRRNRQRLINTRQANMMKWDLGAAFSHHNRWFNSYIDLLIAVFPEYELKTWMFKSLGRSVYRNARDPSRQITTQEQEIISAILNDDQKTINRLGEYCYKLPISAQDEQYKNEAFLLILDNIRTMGEKCPVKLEILWRSAMKYCRINDHFRHNKEISTDDEGFLDRQNAANTNVFGANRTEDLDNGIIIRKIYDSSTPAEQKLLKLFLNDEIEIEDKGIAKLIVSQREKLGLAA